LFQAEYNGRPDPIDLESTPNYFDGVGVVWQFEMMLKQSDELYPLNSCAVENGISLRIESFIFKDYFYEIYQ